MAGWRCANKRRTMRPQTSAVVEAHLGDIPDVLDAPIRLPYRTHHEGPPWIERGTAAAIGCFGVLSYAALIVAMVVALFVSYTPLRVQ